MSSKRLIWNVFLNESVSKISKNMRINIGFIFLYTVPPDLLTFELPVPVILLTTPWSLEVTVLVSFAAVGVCVPFYSPVSFSLFLVGSAFSVVFLLDLEALLDFVMFIDDA